MDFETKKLQTQNDEIAVILDFYQIIRQIL